MIELLTKAGLEKALAKADGQTIPTTDTESGIIHGAQSYFSDPVALSVAKKSPEEAAREVTDRNRRNSAAKLVKDREFKKKMDHIENQIRIAEEAEILMRS